METVTKLDVARRNLAAAIRHFFSQQDPIATHTLAAAAQNVLRDLARVRGLERLSILHDHPDVGADQRAAWVRSINRARNFFKHADEDPDGVLEFDEEDNVFVLLDAVLLLSQFPDGWLREANVFIGWFTTANPEMRPAVSGNQIGDFCVRNTIAATDMIRFREFLDSDLLIEPNRRDA
jgi:hypothetical protein